MLSRLNERFSQIHTTITQHGGMLPVEFVQSLLMEFDVTEDQLLSAMLSFVSESSLCPISHFKVGAIAVGMTGNWYAGANHEYQTLPLALTVHAEQAAVAMAHVHGETGITKIAASKNPCGFCRQFLNEISNASELNVLLPDGCLSKLSQLLPYAFGPAELGVRGGLLSTSSPQLTSHANDAVEEAALHAASRSYSPYAKSHAGVALAAKDGRIFQGSYLENAAFNPGLQALQAAFVHLVQSGAQFADVTEAVLVQHHGAVNHQALTEMVLRVMCPQVKLRVIMI